MKIIFLFGMILLALPIVTADDPCLGTFKQYETVRLIQTCANCTFNNITSVIAPDSTVVVSDVAMTKSGTEYNYSFGDTTKIGRYFYNGFGDLDGVYTIWSCDFDVTPTGVEQISILENPLLIIFLIVGILLLIAGFYLGNPWFGFMGSIMFLFGGIYTMIYGFSNEQNFYTQGLALTSLGLGVIFMFFSAYEWMAWGEDND